MLLGDDQIWRVRGTCGEVDFGDVLLSGVQTKQVDILSLLGSIHLDFNAVDLVSTQ